MRPSIVVGDCRSGWTSAFNVLYWPLRAFARGLFTAVPAIPSAPVDVVSVDYVADAIHELCESDGGIGETYPPDRRRGREHDRRDRAAGQPILPPARCPGCCRRPSSPRCDARRAEGSALDASRAYFPYFAIGDVFEQAATRARLEPRGISVTPLREYLERLLDFATRSRWGKRPIARADALAT